MARKYYRRRRNYGEKKKRSYTAAEKQSYKRGFLAGLFSAKKNKSSNSKKSTVVKKRTLADIPNSFQHNVLFDDDTYKGIYRHYVREMGLEHETARDYALTMYKKKYGDKILREHYGL